MPLAIEPKARPTFDNLTSPTGGANNAFLQCSLQGLTNGTKAAGVGGLHNDGAVTLEESSVGAPFAPFEASFQARDATVALVRGLLYPPPTATRSQVESGTAAFRYLSLIYSSEGSDVTNHFQNMSQWYGDNERAAIAQAISLLEDALAAAPLDTQLRGLLLKSITDKYLAVLNQYSQLFSNPVEGVEPADFDPSVPRGVPFGYYIFQKEQANRNQVRSRFFEADPNSTPSDLPVADFNTATKTTTKAAGGVR